MRLPGRKITIVFRRNESKDEQQGGIEYTGYDLYWPSGPRVQGLAFDRFCKIGVRYILGRDKPDVAVIQGCFVPLADRFDPLPRVPGARIRVLCLERSGSQLTILLSDATPTEIVFDVERDEAPILEWLGAHDIAEGSRQWFGFYAIRQDHAEVTVPVRRGARASRAASIRPRASLLNGEADGMFVAP